MRGVTLRVCIFLAATPYGTAGLYGQEQAPREQPANTAARTPVAQLAGDGSGKAGELKLYPVIVGGKYGYIDSKGKVVIQPQFDEARIFSCGRAAVRSADRWGYVDAKGKWVVKPELKWAGDFSEGLADVKSAGLAGYMNESGELVIPYRYKWAGRFSGGLAAVEVDGKWGYMDRTGSMAIAPKFSCAEEFSEGVAVVMVDRKTEEGYFTSDFAYADRTGNVIFGGMEQMVVGGRFSCGLAPIPVEEGVGYIDRTGAVVIRPKYEDASSFSEGLAVFAVGGKYGYIDTKGNVAIKAKFDYADDFHEGLAAVEVDGKWGYIDKTGSGAIEPRFDEAEEFCGGLARVGVTVGKKKVPASGKIETGPADEEVHVLDEDVVVITSRKYGYINREGAYVWEPSR